MCHCCCGSPHSSNILLKIAQAHVEGFFCPCLHPDTVQVVQVSIVILTDSQTSRCFSTGGKLFLSNVISLLQQRDWHENWVQPGDQVGGKTINILINILKKIIFNLILTWTKALQYVLVPCLLSSSTHFFSPSHAIRVAQCAIIHHFNT